MNELIIIGSIKGELAAQVVKSRLESDNIPVLLHYESASRVYGIMDGLGVVKIIVPKKFVTIAKKIIVEKTGFIPSSEEIVFSEGMKTIKQVVIHKAGKPYEGTGTDEELDSLREVLSCITCKFDNLAGYQEGRPWCVAPRPPQIEKKYCHTFQSKR